jgi:hypothetical protein
MAETYERRYDRDEGKEYKYQTVIKNSSQFVLERRHCWSPSGAIRLTC